MREGEQTAHRSEKNTSMAAQRASPVKARSPSCSGTVVIATEVAGVIVYGGGIFPLPFMISYLTSTIAEYIFATSSATCLKRKNEKEARNAKKMKRKKE